MLEERSHAVLVAVLRAVQDAVVVVDPQGRITHLNPVAERLTGWSFHEARGRPADAVVDLRSDGSCGAGPASRSSAWLQPRMGPPTQVRRTVVPVTGPNDEDLGVVLVLQDITEEERLHHLLAHADRLASMGMMAAAIAHEINNPLTYILANLDHVLLASQLESTEIRDALHDAVFGAKAIERIVGDLKLLTLPDQRVQEAVDVAQVLRRSQRMAAKTVRARGRFEASLRTTQPLFANPVALGQVVTNLVINAAQALPEVYSEDSVVRLSCEDDGQYVVICVSDNGVGIPEEIQDRIFDPFFTTKDVGKGTGLGLAICRQIVSSLDGQIQVDSTSGVGTTVTVTIPAVSDIPDDRDDMTSLWPVDDFPSRRVLVIDDDDKVRRSIDTVLRRHHTVKLLGSVDEAVEHLSRGYGYDAVLCDLMMSPRHGVELLDELRRIAPDLIDKTAFITGGVFTGALHERVRESGRPVAYKPFSPDRLHRLVEELAQS